ncbi:MAG: hypothetical protein ACYTFK_07355, partial [Planctomycetota bacterium]
GWQLSPNYEDTGLGDRTQYTYTVKARDLSINMNETAASVAKSATTQDGTPPDPDPMTWDTVPYATGTSSIAMVATTATDPNGVQYYFDPNGVQYYFNNITDPDPNHDSGWQDSPFFEDTGLSELTAYAYIVKARDLSSNYNETLPSVIRSVTTQDGTAPTPDPMTWSSVPQATWATWTVMTASLATDPSGVEYYFTELSGNSGGADSGWQNSRVYTNTGLDAETEYIYTVTARDKSVNHNETLPSSPESIITPAPRPPVASDVAVSAHMEMPAVITFDAIDDGLPNPPAALSYVITSLPSHGTLSDPGGGIIGTVGYVLVNNGNKVVYTSDSEYLGFDSFSYRADDGGVSPRGGESNEADVFISVVIPEYFTEHFYWNDNDLDNNMFTFIPDGTANFYTLCREEVAGFPTDPTGSTAMALGDNNSVRVYLADGKRVSIYGQSYSSFWVGSNGYITFNSSDTSANETFAGHFGKKRISGLFDDLDPSAGGTVWRRQYDDRVVITFENVPEKDAANSNSFQIEMFFEGTIVLTHLNIDATDGLCGLSEGVGISSNFIDSDLSSFFVCADFNGDLKVNSSDFGILAEYWLDENCSDLIWCEGTDLDRSEQVDEFDLSHFSQYWLEKISLAPPVEVEDTFRSQGVYDGRIYDDGAGHNGVDSTDVSWEALRLGDNYVGVFDYSYRSIVSFDTSSIPDDARVLSATLEMTRSGQTGTDNPFDWGGDCLIDIVSPHFGDSNELAVEDWDASADAVAIASFLADPGAESPMTSTGFDIQGRMNINKFGLTQMRIYFSTLTNVDTDPDYLEFYSGTWKSDESFRPKLTVKYTTRRPALKFVSIAAEDGRVWDNGSGIGSGATADDTGGSDREALRLGDYSGGQSYRSVVSFDTSAWPEFYEIDSVVLQMTRARQEGVNNPFDWGGTLFVDVASPYLGDSEALETVDWQATPDANSVAYFTADPGEDKTMFSTEFNAEGINAIIRDQKTQLKIYFENPVLDNGVTEYLGFYSGYWLWHESYRPQLIIRFVPE